MKDTSVDPQVIDWERRQSKRAQDPKIAALMASFIFRQDPENAIHMVSLPGARWKFEQYLADVHANKLFVFTGVERDPGVHADMADEAKRLNRPGLMTSIYSPAEIGTTTKVLDSELDCGRPVDIAYFDYMGTWSRSKERDVELVARIGSCGIFACTIALARGRRCVNNELEHLSEVGQTHLGYIIDDTTRHTENPHYKITGTPERIRQLFETHGRRATLLGGFVYDSPRETSGHPSTEMTFVFELEIKREQHGAGPLDDGAKQRKTG